MGLILNWNFSSMFWGISAWHLYLGIVAENTWWAFMREVISIYEGKEKILGYSIMWVTLLFNSVQFSRSVVSDSLRPHESQHARPPCPSPSPGVHSDSCPLSQWCHPAISSSVVPFSSCSQIPPSIRVFSNESTLRMKWPKYWSFSFSIIPSKEIPGLISFRMDWLDLLQIHYSYDGVLHDIYTYDENIMKGYCYTQ